MEDQEMLILNLLSQLKINQERRSNNVADVVFTLIITQIILLIFGLKKEYQGRLSPNTVAIRFDVWTSGNWTHWFARSLAKTYYWQNDSNCNDKRVFMINLK